MKLEDLKQYDGPTGRQPQHPGQPARYTPRPGERDPDALAKEGKADKPARAGADSRDAATGASLPETAEDRARRRAVLGRKS